MRQMMGKGVFAVLILLGASWAQAQSDFQLTDQVIGKDFVGFGAEMNPYLYCTPNYGEMPTILPFTVGNNNPYRQGLVGFGDVTERNVADLEQKVVQLRPQHVRIFLLLDWWSLTGDRGIAKGDPRMVDSLVRTVRLAQRAGATVNLTLWYGKYFKTQPDRTGKEFGRIVADLIEQRGLTAIQYLTIQNEVNGEGEGGGMRLTFDQYHRLYRALDAELKARGLRDRIKIVAGDLVGLNQTLWLNNLAHYLADVCDAYSIHVYWDYWDTPKLKWRLANVEEVAANLPAQGKRPMHITEFGVRGFHVDEKVEPGYFWNGKPIADSKIQAIEIAWFMLEAINGGFVCMVQWDMYDVWYDRRMGYGIIGQPANNWKLKPAYWVLNLFTHTTRPGWESLRVDGSRDDQSVAAMRSPLGELTVFAMNRGEEAADFSIAGVPGNARFRRTVWNANGKGTLGEPDTIAVDDRRLAAMLPPLTVTAFTTLSDR